MDNILLKDRYLNLYVVSVKKRSFYFFYYWDAENQAWNVDLRRGLFDRELHSWVALVEKLSFVHLE